MIRSISGVCAAAIDATAASRMSFISPRLLVNTRRGDGRDADSEGWVNAHPGDGMPGWNRQGTGYMEGLEVPSSRGACVPAGGAMVPLPGPFFDLLAAFLAGGAAFLAGA